MISETGDEAIIARSSKIVNELLQEQRADALVTAMAILVFVAFPHSETKRDDFTDRIVEIFKELLRQ